MKGILFKPWKIKAIADSSPDTEWQTRRVIKLPDFPDKFPEHKNPSEWYVRRGINVWIIENTKINYQEYIKPRYQVGEVVYIKEAWATENKYNHLKPSELPDDAKIFYLNDVDYDPFTMGRVRSPLHLPERFARYFIRITDVRAERLQEITEADCKAEGIYPNSIYGDFGFHWYKKDCGYETAKTAYHVLWDSINKPPYDWESNPWVWVYSFSPVRYQS